MKVVTVIALTLLFLSTAAMRAQNDIESLRGLNSVSFNKVSLDIHVPQGFPFTEEDFRSVQTRLEDDVISALKKASIKILSNPMPRQMFDKGFTGLLVRVSVRDPDYSASLTLTPFVNEDGKLQQRPPIYEKKISREEIGGKRLVNTEMARMLLSSLLDGFLQDYKLVNTK